MASRGSPFVVNSVSDRNGIKVTMRSPARSRVSHRAVLLSITETECDTIYIFNLIGLLIPKRKSGIVTSCIIGIKREIDIPAARSIPCGGYHSPAVGSLHRHAVLSREGSIQIVVPAEIIIARRAGKLRTGKHSVRIIQRRIRPVIVHLGHIVEIHDIVAVAAHSISIVDQSVYAGCDGCAESDTEDGAENRSATDIMPPWRGYGTVVCAEERHRMAVAVGMRTGRTRRTRRSLWSGRSVRSLWPGRTVMIIAGTEISSSGAMIVVTFGTFRTMLLPSVAGAPIGSARTVPGVPGAVVLGSLSRTGMVGRRAVVGRAGCAVGRTVRAV